MALTLLVSAATAAKADLLPRLAQVTGVGAGDVLNVRAEDNAGSADLGDLADGTVIEILDYSATGNWAQIAWQEGNGWIASRYLTEVPRPQLDSGMPADLTCSGTEPFWSLDIAASGVLTFRTPEVSLTDQITWSTQSRNEGQSRYAFGDATKTAVLSREQCIAGGTGQLTGWSLAMTINGDTPSLLSGCCTAN